MNTPLIAVIIVIALIIGSTLSIMNKALRLSRLVCPDVHRAPP